MNSRSTVILIPAHNRCRTTLRCLHTLRETGSLAWATAVVIDDGSTDGTSQAIAAEFPHVVLLAGDGNLWWTGALTRGMSFAASHRAEQIVWLNDDCFPHQGALEALVAHTRQHGCISVAQSFTPVGAWYGGHRKTWWGLKQVTCPDDEIRECDAFSGNCVCIPSGIVEAIGLPDGDTFPMDPADADYGLRARAAGFSVQVVGAASCDSGFEPAQRKVSWLLGEESSRSIWQSFSTRNTTYGFAIYRRFCVRHWGPWGYVLFCLPYLRFGCTALLRILIPKTWLLKLYRTRSQAWQHGERAKKAGPE